MSITFKQEVMLEVRYRGGWIPDSRWTNDWDEIVFDFTRASAKCRIVMRGGLVIAEKEGIDEYED